jgi:hypothetical protein
LVAGFGFLWLLAFAPFSRRRGPSVLLPFRFRVVVGCQFCFSVSLIWAIFTSNNPFFALSSWTDLEAEVDCWIWSCFVLAWCGMDGFSLLLSFLAIITVGGSTGTCVSIYSALSTLTCSFSHVISILSYCFFFATFDNFTMVFSALVPFSTDLVNALFTTVN